MGKTRQVLAVTMVAAALCAADTSVKAAPAQRAQVGSVARQLASRITSSFQVTIPAMRLDQLRQRQIQPWVAAMITPDQPVFVHAVQSTPFQFRLPPPIL